MNIQVGKYVVKIDASDVHIINVPGCFLTVMSIRGKGYVCRTSYAKKPGSGLARVNEYLHRLIMNAKKGDIIDHIDANPLNNQRSNLRFVTTSQNHMNRVKHRGKSRFKGVSPHAGLWRARIKVGGIEIHLGRFVSEEDAAKAYDAAARNYFGEYARLNFPT